ncbi:MAG: WG repeat-containing protein, partial [Cyanobacteriota bacterium]
MNKKALIILSGLFLMILVTTNQSLSIKYKEDEGGRCPIMPPNYYKTENLKKEKLNNYFETMSIKFKGKYTYMNKSGDLITTKKFEKASPFTEERAFVMENDKWGIIDTSGNYVVEPQFDDFVPYYNGMAQVGIKTDEILDVEYAVVTGSGYVTITKYRHKWGIIDKNGNYILKPSYNSSFKFY